MFIYFFFFKKKNDTHTRVYEIRFVLCAFFGGERGFETGVSDWLSDVKENSNCVLIKNLFFFLSPFSIDLGGESRDYFSFCNLKNLPIYFSSFVMKMLEFKYGVVIDFDLFIYFFLILYSFPIGG